MENKISGFFLGKSLKSIIGEKKYNKICKYLDISYNYKSHRKVKIIFQTIFSKYGRALASTMSKNPKGY